MSYEDQKVYGLDIPCWLHWKVGVRKQRFITIQGVEVYEKTWYKAVSLAQSTYMLYKRKSWHSYIFLSHGNKGTRKKWCVIWQVVSNVEAFIMKHVDVIPH